MDFEYYAYQVSNNGTFVGGIQATPGDWIVTTPEDIKIISDREFKALFVVVRGHFKKVN